MNRSIFGSAPPKFVYDYEGENEVSIDLDYWITTKDEVEDKELIQESELEADREIISRGSYLLFEGRINLHKYLQKYGMVYTQNKFESIIQFNNKKVALWKHRDGQAFKDGEGNIVLFHLRVIPKNLTALDYRDVLFLKFRSLSGASQAQEFIPIPSINQIRMNEF
jgi:hypothetical protein